MFTLITRVLCSVLLRVPASYFFGITLGWELKGIGYGALTASVGVLLIIIVYLFTGNWKENVINHTPEPLEVLEVTEAADAAE